MNEIQVYSREVGFSMTLTGLLLVNLNKKMFAYLFSSTQVQSQELIDDIFVGISVG